MKDPWFSIAADEPTIKEIQQAVCARFPGLTPPDLTRDDRPLEVIMPRHLAMYLARILTQKSTPAIGMAFRRDHTTVLTASKKIKSLSKTDSKIAGIIREIREELGA